MADQLTAIRIRRRDALLFGGFITSLAIIQLAVSARPGRHERFLAMFGNSWDDLAGLRLHRLVTSSFIQADNGLSASILVLLIAAAIAAGLRAGDHRLVPRRHHGQRCSLLVLPRACGAWIRARRGVSRLARCRLSSGANAVMTAALLTLSGPRRRVLGVGALAAAQVPPIVLTGNPAYVHHLIAIATTIIAYEWWDRRPLVAVHE